MNPRCLRPARPARPCRWGLPALARGRFAVGAVLAGIIADLVGLRAAVAVIAAITAASGVVVATRMYETHSRPTEFAARPGQDTQR